MVKSGDDRPPAASTPPHPGAVPIAGASAEAETAAPKPLALSTSAVILPGWLVGLVARRAVVQPTSHIGTPPALPG